MLSQNGKVWTVSLVEAYIDYNKRVSFIPYEHWLGLEIDWRNNEAKVSAFKSDWDKRVAKIS